MSAIVKWLHSIIFKTSVALFKLLQSDWVQGTHWLEGGREGGREGNERRREEEEERDITPSYTV